MHDSYLNKLVSLRSLQWGLLAPWHFLAKERCRLVIKASNFSDYRT